MAVVHVRIPDWVTVETLAECIKLGVDAHGVNLVAKYEIGKGQLINGIPPYTILVQLEEA